MYFSYNKCTCIIIHSTHLCWFMESSRIRVRRVRYYTMVVVRHAPQINSITVSDYIITIPLWCRSTCFTNTKWNVTLNLWDWKQRDCSCVRTCQRYRKETKLYGLVMLTVTINCSESWPIITLILLYGQFQT